MLLTLFLEILLSVIVNFGIFKVIYKLFASSYRACKREEEMEDANEKTRKGR